MPFFFLGTQVSLFAQDIIYRQDGKSMEVNIKEVGTSVIKYTEVDDPNGVVFIIEKDLINNITLEGARDITSLIGDYGFDYYKNQKYQVVKFNFFPALRLNTIAISYERAVDPISSLEGTVRVLGIGMFEDTDDIKGAGFDIGYKFKFKGRIKKSEVLRPDPILHGTFIKITAGYNHVNEKYGDFFTQQVGEIKSDLVNFGIDVGKQWLFNNNVTIDLFAGVHYFFGPSNFYYSNGQVDNLIAQDRDFAIGDFIYGPNQIGYAFGLRFGIPFGKYQFKEKETKSSRRKK